MSGEVIKATKLTPSIATGGTAGQHLAKKTSANYDTEWVDPSCSAGCLAPPSYTNNGSGSITVPSVEVMLYTNSLFAGSPYKYTLGALTAVLTDQTMNYIIADYNAGNPILRVTLDVSVITESEIVPVLSVFRDGNDLEVQNWDSLGRGLPNKIHQSLVKTQRYRRATGLALSEHGTRNVTCSEGVVWVGAAPISLPEVVSETHNIIYFARSGGAWVKSSVTQYNNTEYSDGTNTQTLTANRYAVNWLYRGVEDHRHLYLVLGLGNYSLSEAQSSQAPATLPAKISSHALLVGRIIVKKGVNTASEIGSAFATTYSMSAAAIHNDLSELQGGSTEERYHLTAAQATMATGLSTVYTDTREPTGWIDPAAVSVSYDSTARTVTLTGTLTYYNRGVRTTLTSPWVSTPHPSVTGHYYMLHFNASGVESWSTDAHPGFDKALIAFIRYESSVKFGMRECHGLMQWQSHKELHETIGTHLERGGLVPTASWAPNTNTVAAVTPAVDESVIDDEDLGTTVPAATDGSTYTRCYIQTGAAVFVTGSTLPYPDDGTDMQYNSNPLSGTALSSITTSNSWLNVYCILMPVSTDAGSQVYRHIWIVGQRLYTSLASAQAEDFRVMQLGTLAELAPEMLPYIRVTYRRDASYSNTKRARLEASAITYLTGSKMSLVSLSGVSPTAHESLTGLQGGTTNEYFHLTSTQHQNFPLSFESVSQNLKGYSHTLSYTGDDLTSIVYDLGGGSTITETLSYTLGVLTSVVLSGSTPAGILLTKTLSYTGGKLTGVSYS